MNDYTPRCGLFGKVPQQPDFIAHELDPGFCNRWHPWLQAALSVSREQLEESWLDVYLTSPVWRFAAEAGVCCERSVAGVMIPSVDEVGRFFPLVLAHLGDHTPWSAYVDHGSWYPQAEEVVLSALDEGVSYAQLLAAVDALPTPRFQPLPGVHVNSTAPGVSRAQAFHTVASEPGSTLLALTGRAYGELLGRCSLWWTEGSRRVEPCLLVTPELPEAGQLSAMFDGDWQQWGWSAAQIVTHADQPRI